MVDLMTGSDALFFLSIGLVAIAFGIAGLVGWRE